LRKQISILAHARNSESQTKQSAPCLNTTFRIATKHLRKEAVCITYTANPDFHQDDGFKDLHRGRSVLYFSAA